MAQSGGRSEGKTRQAEKSPSSLSEVKEKPRRGFVSRVWSSMAHLLFRNSKEDFEKRLQHLSKEEVLVHSRMKKRTQFWRKFARNLIIYSVLSEAIVLGVAIYSTRTTEMAWQTRAWRVLPVFALPLLTTLIYSSCGSLHRMRERRDQRTLERLRLERQEKIDELKERTNYYLTQQLIQKYDIDPAAKAAAASVLASKLGSESGLKFALQAADALDKEETGRSSGRAPSSGQSNDVDTGMSSGLKQRRNSQKPNRTGTTNVGQANPRDRRMENADRLLTGGGDMDLDGGWERQQYMERQQENVEYYQRGKSWDGGWLARLAAMLVGEDPSQCYALVCGKCHMHNGLAKKEDFQYITYYCPHCNALNKSNHLEGDSKEQAAQEQPAGASRGVRSGPAEEVFSTSGGTLSPVQDTAPTDSAVTSSELISALVQESLPESERNTILEENPVQPHPM